ncbi:hypothetical protein ACRAWF_24445 [Streptomyces sp. L7]
MAPTGASPAAPSARRAAAERAAARGRSPKDSVSCGDRRGRGRGSSRNTPPTPRSGWDFANAESAAVRSAPLLDLAQTIIQVSKAVVPKFSPGCRGYGTSAEQVVAGRGVSRRGVLRTPPPCGAPVALEPRDEPGRWDDVVPVGGRRCRSRRTRRSHQCMTTGDPVLGAAAHQRAGRAHARRLAVREAPTSGR